MTRVLPVALAATLLAGTAVAVTADAATAAPVLSVTSTRADLVSDGQALVDVAGTAKGLRVTLNGKDVTARFAQRSNGRTQGLVTGLRLGTNALVAKRQGARSALTVTNHRNGGPLFGGPQLQPWRCPTGSLNAQCDRPAVITYQYKSIDPTKAGLQAYDPKSPPSDVATVTTDEGVTVPFVVRQELGYLARDEYKVLSLWDPKKPWTRWSPQKTWNHKVLVPGGGGCGGSYSTGGAPLDDFSGTIPSIPGRDQSYVDALGKGYVVMSTALANTGHNCNVATEAEALMMLKERVVEQYGDIRYTIGTGCSGGSIVQHTVANAYPGAVYDGLIVTCAYPDTLTAGAQFADYHLLRLYFEDPSRWGTGVVWSPTQFAAVEGHLTHANAVVADEGLFKDAVSPVGDCVPPAQAYSASNPKGVRCSILDHSKTLFGPRPKAVWTAQEKKAGRGFAGVPFSNLGIQYGLQALQDGLITAEQFVDLNEKVGGLDIDAQLSAARLEGDDTAVANSYRTGMVDLGDHLDEVPIIDHAGPDPGAAHDYAHTHWVRDRLDKANGHHDNQVLWYGPTPLIGDPSWPTAALVQMDRWLDRISKDRSNRSRATKVRADKPADLTDRCTAVPSQPVSPADAVCPPDLARTRLSTPREVAGGPVTNEVLKCRLKALDPADYGVLGLLPDQLARLKKVFPKGVCDWSRPGVGQQPVVPWQTYGTSTTVVYGGRPLPAAPRATS